jgi:hypothetical protein
MARQAASLHDRLPVPLEVAHLLLVQHTPLSIRFRFDEKRFDIDGAYNMRYEIVKKRIDKAHIRGAHERLTQPGTIAIVYSQPREALDIENILRIYRRQGIWPMVLRKLSWRIWKAPRDCGLSALRSTCKSHRSSQGRLTTLRR